MKDYRDGAAKSGADQMAHYKHLSGFKDESARAKGGAAKKSKTQVNVVVAPRGGERAAQSPVSAGQAPAAQGGLPSRPVAPAVPVSPPQAGGLGALGGMRPPMSKGGKAHKRADGGGVKVVKGYDAGSGSAAGRLEKERHIRRMPKPGKA